MMRLPQHRRKALLDHPHKTLSVSFWVLGAQAPPPPATPDMTREFISRGSMTRTDSDNDSDTRTHTPTLSLLLTLTHPQTHTDTFHLFFKLLQQNL
eukprot:sb/3479116/